MFFGVFFVFWVDVLFFLFLSCGCSFFAVGMIDDNPMLIHYCCYYSDNLTFSLAPGWAFVESEDWRKDVQCAWSGCGGDAGMPRYFFFFFVLFFLMSTPFYLAFFSWSFLSLLRLAVRFVSLYSLALHRTSPDGWAYTNDAWFGSRPAPYISSEGSVTRRRRWVRRVWYDPRRASVDG